MTDDPVVNKGSIPDHRGYEQEYTISVSCCGKNCGAGFRYEEKTYKGDDVESFRERTLSLWIRRGWKNIGRKWYCEKCAASVKTEGSS